MLLLRPRTTPVGETAFPPRNEPFAFRTQLETYYRDTLGRSTTASYVDVEGDIVWTQEYLRYRVNYCGHADAVQKVLQQIDGGGIAPTCYTPPPPPAPPPAGPCAYALGSTSVVAPQAGGQFSLALTRTSGNCGWTASTSYAWIGLANASGSASGSFTYTLSALTELRSRTGAIAIQWTGGSTWFQVEQVGSRADCPTTGSISMQAYRSEALYSLFSAPMGCTPLPGYATADSWIRFAGTHGGGQQLDLFADANPGPARTGHLTFKDSIGTLYFDLTVSQAAGDCATGVSPTSLTFDYRGGSATVSVTGATGCQWSVGLIGSVPVTNVSPASGSGNGTVTITVAPSTYPRIAASGTLYIGMIPVALTQTAQ